MEKNGWLRCEVAADGGPRARREYYLTDKGQGVLRVLCGHVTELYREVVLEADPDRARPAQREGNQER
jgi:DNA-binding PadR family transcriptional regulator